ncbi:MAG: hypothetical protein GAK28_04940 [Luteibacter sp.]|uniref:hypothetical protein n=1 Tax=Luteibacter sp. TaxID=1886636 RepID=UPI0013841748|nr:hypothetical protein [Luteibacter sp.]KAF1003101.1 MAG: hypothetical protein GAK28_04940 [Luteibacter sp.]
MGIEHGMGIENVQIGVALFLMLINVLIFIDQRQGDHLARRGARGFAVGAFIGAIVMLLALDHLMIQVWIHPSDDMALLVFHTAMIGMSLATSAAVGFWIVSRWDV